jgi:hypothetical protein
MRYSKSLLLYQDDAPYGSFLKLIFLIVPAGLLIAGSYLWTSGEPAGGIVLLLEAFVVGVILWLVFPRKYQVYEDHLRIVLGGPFSVRVSFESITDVRVTSRGVALTMNFPTRFTRTYVMIARRGGLGIAITPKSNEQFVENANQAIKEWARRRALGVRPPQ